MSNGLNSLEVLGTMKYFEFLLEPQVISSALTFMGTEFSLRKLQESKSYITLSSILWFVNLSKVNVESEGMKIKLIKSCDSLNEAFVVNVGKVSIEEYPSQELVSSYSSEASVDMALRTYDEDAALPSSGVGSESKGAVEGVDQSQKSESSDLEKKKKAPSFNLITLNVKNINYYYIYLCVFVIHCFLFRLI